MPHSFRTRLLALLAALLLPTLPAMAATPKASSSRSSHGPAPASTANGSM